MKPIMMATALAVMIGAAGSGYALGGYATGGQRADAEMGWGRENAAPEIVDSAPQQTAAAVALDPASPEHYVCHGCGPTLAQRREQSAMADIPTPSDAGFGDVPSASDLQNPYH